jgi:hypothetical protein
MPNDGPVGKVILVKYDHFMYRDLQVHYDLPMANKVANGLLNSSMPAPAMWGN